MVSARPMGHSRRRAARVLARQATNQRLLVGIVKFVAARMDSGPLSLHRSRTLAAASPPLRSDRGRNTCAQRVAPQCRRATRA